MDKFWRFCRWLRLALLVLLVLGVAGLAFYTHTDGFREFVRQKLVTAINDSVRGKISVARLDGSVWGSLTLIDLRLADNEAEIARIPRLKVNFALLPLIWGRIQILHLEAAQPLVWLKEGQDGVWNIVEALSPAEPQSETPSLIVSIGSLELQKADIDVSFSGNSYRLTGLDLQGTAGIRPDLTTVDLRQVSSRVLTNEMPEARVKGALAYDDRGGLESLTFSDFIIESGSSGLRLTGKIDDLKTLETTAKVSIDKLAPADIVHFVPQWPVKANVSGTANLRGPLTALKGDFSLSVADGSLSGNFQADVARDLPMYQGSVKITRVNLLKLLERKELQGVVSALVEVNGSGFALANLAGQGEANIRSTEIAAWNLGDVSLKASLARSEAKITGHLTSELGHADWQGQIALRDIPQYELSFSASQLNIQKISAGQTIKGNLNLAGTIKGSGLTPAAMNTLAKIDVRRSTVGGVELEQGTLVATIANQRIRIEQGLLKATDATLSVKGDIGTDPKQQGQLDYHVRVNTLSPWLALLDRQGSGSVNLIGGAKGNLSDLKAQGKLTVRSISFAGTTIQSGSIDYNLGYSSLRPLPFGTLNVNLSDIRAGYQMQSLDGVIKILPQTPTVFDLDVKARDAQNRNHTVAARLDYQPGHVLARLTRLTLDLPDGTWRLAQPATVEQRDQDFLVDRLLMRNNGRELFLDGQFSLTGNQALRLNVEKLPLETMRAFFPEAPDITGMLSAQLQLAGSAAAPQVVATLRLENSKIAGYSYAGLVASGSYRDQKAEVKATVQQDQLHVLNATATLPMTVSWSNGWRAEVGSNIDARIQSSGLSLAFLNAFSGKAIQGIAGEVEVDLQVRGSLNQPLTSGVLRVRDGKLTPTALGVQVSSVTAEGLLEPPGIKISQISARANKGELNGSGFIALQKFVPQRIDLAIAAKQWPAINTQQYQIEVDGTAKIDGTFTAPRITGKFEVPRGELRPDLSFLDRSNTPVKRDPTITVISTTAGGKSAAKPESNGQGDSDLWRSASIDIQVRIPNNLWIRHRNGNTELSGNLRVTKASGGNPAVTGLIETIRGWVGFQGRRFTLTRGRLEFGGGEKIDPSLDIVAEYRAGNYLISALVKGTAEKPTLTLASDPQLDQADILSVLLFNKTLSNLEKSEQASLQQNAISITSGFAAAQIGQAVSQALGLQELGVDITNVSVSQDVSGKYGQEVSAEYRITSEWRFSVSASTVGPDGVDLIWQKRY
ncbi:MAG TPA: translocation/assembly module TamB domain-containing protein [Candidatus Binatia bacterium]|nr:translocation/assembly module TamB domain-containing protein [Candidatus Binatia bacterium]